MVLWRWFCYTPFCGRSQHQGTSWHGDHCAWPVSPSLIMASPWPDQPCPYPACMRQIRDLLAEMVPSEDQAKPEFRAVAGQMPGGAITCPYCQGAVEYQADGKSLAISARIALRYSRDKMERRAKDYGSQKSPPDLGM